MNKNDIISKLIDDEKFLVERPAMTAFRPEEIQEAIYTSFNLINAECSGLPIKVWTFNYPAYENPPQPVDENNELYRTKYEIDQFFQAVVVQTQYTLNMGNDFSQGSSTFSTGGISASIQRPEKRDVLAPGVLLFLQNARLYQLQSYSPVKNLFSKDPCNELEQFITYEVADKRFVHQYQDNAQVGNVCVINENKQVSFQDPNTVSFKLKNADNILDTDGNYKRIQDVNNLAFFGPSGTNAATKTEINQLIQDKKIYNPNYTYSLGEIIGRYNNDRNTLQFWISNQDNNRGHDPLLDNAGYVWWRLATDNNVQAKSIWDPVDKVYKMINQFNAEYFGGLSKEQIYIAINSSGTSWSPSITYREGFVCIFVDSNNSLSWYQSLQNGNIGHIPETSPTWWKKLPTPSVDVNEVIAQITPYIDAEITKKITNEIEKWKTSITTDFANSVYTFADQQAFERFINDNPVLTADMFEDISKEYYTKQEADNKYAIKSQTNSFTEPQNFDSDINIRGANPDNKIWFSNFNYANKNISAVKFVKGSGTNLLQIEVNNNDNTSAISAPGTNNKLAVSNLRNPVNANDAANKAYVDSQITTVNNTINSKDTAMSNRVNAVDTKLNGVIDGLQNGNIVNYVGNWDANTTYKIGQAITHNDLWFVSNKNNNRGHQPTNTSDEWWELLTTPPSVNLADYYTKNESNQRYYTKSDADGRFANINNVYNKSEVYTKTEVDRNFTLQSSHNSLVDRVLELNITKADKSSLSNYYTKSEVDNKVIKKTSWYRFLDYFNWDGTYKTGNKGYRWVAKCNTTTFWNLIGGYPDAKDRIINIQFWAKYKSIGQEGQTPHWWKSFVSFTWDRGQTEREILIEIDSPISDADDWSNGNVVNDLYFKIIYV